MFFLYCKNSWIRISYFNKLYNYQSSFSRVGRLFISDSELSKMGVDYEVCDICLDTYCDCGDYVSLSRPRIRMCSPCGTTYSNCYKENRIGEHVARKPRCDNEMLIDALAMRKQWVEEAERWFEVPYGKGNDTSEEEDDESEEEPDPFEAQESQDSNGPEGKKRSREQDDENEASGCEKKRRVEEKEEKDPEVLPEEVVV